MSFVRNVVDGHHVLWVVDKTTISFVEGTRAAIGQFAGRFVRPAKFYSFLQLNKNSSINTTVKPVLRELTLIVSCSAIITCFLCVHEEALREENVTTRT